jgi:MoaA/NifB/PqqE/SkfB family radical SAM enzyme
MLIPLIQRMWRTTDARLLWKFAYNFGFKGMLSVERFKRRLRKGVVFPPFLYLSIINSCNLRCRGCWVDVGAERRMIPLDELNRLIRSAKKHGNRFFGILGGEPFLHPDLMTLLRAHPDCYFQIFTNGHFITDEVAAELRRIGNATPLVSVEGTELVSDQRRGRAGVYSKTLAGLEACLRNRLITGVTTSVCRNNYDDLVREEWVDELIGRGVHYVWYTTYRPVGPDPAPELALDREQMLGVRRFAMRIRNTKPIIVVDAYWDQAGRALCPAVIGISHHVGPGGDIEPCPVVQFAKDTIRDHGGDVFKAIAESKFLADFRRTAAGATRGCIILEHPEVLHRLVSGDGVRDTTARGTGAAELAAMEPRPSQYQPGAELPEENWMYRVAKRYWFFGFGAYN